MGCDIMPDEKIIIVYQNSYISDKQRKEKESQGWKIVEGVRVGRDGKPVEPHILPLAV
ncbi:unnamed protein product [marine sediment metagenome]|uniref:Uncharacterized protein n=1 Tax=marine sediment metagenome TaxID=412755 RepID=X1EBV5_9ZZZZ